MPNFVKPIIYILDNFDVSGVTTVIRQYTNVLANQGLKPIVIGFEKDLPNPSESFKNCQVFCLSVETGRFLPAKMRKWLIRPFILAKTLNEIISLLPEKPQLHFSSSQSMLMSLLSVKTWGLLKIFTLHGFTHREYLYYFQYGQPPWNHKLVYQFKLFQQKLCLKLSHKILVLSLYSKKQILADFGSDLANKIVIIPGFVDSIKKTAPSKLKPKKILHFLNFGRAEYRKGLDILIQAGTKLATQTQNFLITIVSPVVYLNWNYALTIYEESGLFDKIRLLPNASSNRINRLLNKADVFVMPSKDLETFGMTMIEAMAQGVPVIGTRVGAIPEILQKVDKRLIASKPTPHALANRLIWYSQLSSNDRQLLREKSLAVVKKYYSIEAVSPAILELYGIKS